MEPVTPERQPTDLKPTGGDVWAMVAAAFAILWAPLVVMLGGLAVTLGLMYLWIMH